MEPAVRSPRIKSAITTGRAQNDALLASKTPKIPGTRAALAVKTLPRGNGISGCRDWRPKISLRDGKRTRRPKEGNDTGENPHRNGLSRVGGGICGFVGLDGGVRSQMRTGLLRKIPDNREFNREIRPKDPLRSIFVHSFPCVTNDLPRYSRAIGIGNLLPILGKFSSVPPSQRAINRTGYCGLGSSLRAGVGTH